MRGHATRVAWVSLRLPGSVPRALIAVATVRTHIYRRTARVHVPEYIVHAHAFTWWTGDEYARDRDTARNTKRQSIQGDSDIHREREREGEAFKFQNVKIAVINEILKSEVQNDCSSKKKRKELKAILIVVTRSLSQVTYSD